jgi:hypothetical protein
VTSVTDTGGVFCGFFRLGYKGALLLLDLSAEKVNQSRVGLQIESVICNLYNF